MRGRLAARLAGLSGRRRALIAGVALVVVAAVAAAAIAASVGGGSPGAAASPAQNRPGPVLLVPGYGGSTSSLDLLANRIRATGRKATVLRLPGTGTGSLITDAALLNTAVNERSCARRSLGGHHRLLRRRRRGADLGPPR